MASDTEKRHFPFKGAVMRPRKDSTDKASGENPMVNLA